MSLFIGYEVGTGKPVKVPVFFMLVTGQTRLSGKTTFLKAVAKQAVKQGYKVLVLDSKTNLADYEGFGEDVPVCLKQSTDSLILLGLLESIFERKITRDYSTLTRITEGAKTFEDVITNAKVLKGKSRAGWVRDSCTKLIDLLQRLLEQARKTETSTKLVLPYPINRMAINEFETPAQQLIAKTVFEEALRMEKVIVILDEAYKFLPQKWRSACARAVQDYVTQGGATECYLWMATQFLAPTNKDTMKAMAVKMLGTQDHDTECEHTMDLIPFAKGTYTTDVIMRLKLGHFVVVTKEWVKTVYVVPEYADEKEVIEVALGKRKPEELHYNIPINEEKKKLEQEHIKIVKVEKTKMKTPMITITIPAQMTLPVTPEKKQSSDDKHISKIEDRLTKLEKEIKQSMSTVDQWVKNHKNVKNVELQETTTKVKLSKTVKSMSVSDETLRGKILTLAKEGFFKTWHPLREVVSALEEHKWTVNINSVKSELTRMSEDGILGRKKKNRENIYALSPNVTFEGD